MLARCSSCCFCSTYTDPEHDTSSLHSKLLQVPKQMMNTALAQSRAPRAEQTPSLEGECLTAPPPSLGRRRALAGGLVVSYVEPTRPANKGLACGYTLPARLQVELQKYLASITCSKGASPLRSWSMSVSRTYQSIDRAADCTRKKRGASRHQLRKRCEIPTGTPCRLLLWRRALGAGFGRQR